MFQQLHFNTNVPTLWETSEHNFREVGPSAMEFREWAKMSYGLFITKEMTGYVYGALPMFQGLQHTLFVCFNI